MLWYSTSPSHSNPNASSVRSMCVGAAGDHARRVEVFDAHQPARAVGARVEIAADGGQQRAEVQRSGGRGREPGHGLAPDNGKRRAEAAASVRFEDTSNRRRQR